jgi:ATP-dependent Lhr-like helicase
VSERRRDDRARRTSTAAETKSSDGDVLELFGPATSAWFRSSFDAPTRAQALAWPSIAAGRSTLLLAPTGSGKTLSAFLAAIDRLSRTPATGKVRVLYVSPIKALAVDVERNLRAPIAGIVAAAARASISVRAPTVAVRTGDTPAKERTAMRKHPPDVLITTPESLYLLLTSGARAMLTDVETVIVDEIHALVPTKRGAHLFASLERLAARRSAGSPPLVRIGLSATQRPLDEVARLLGGLEGGAARPIEIVDATSKKAFDVRIEVPVDDMAALADGDAISGGNASTGPAPRSIWPSIHPRLLELIRAHRTTLIFANSRRLAERLAGALNDLAAEQDADRRGLEVPVPVEIARAHHGSIAREQRLLIEDALKRGTLPCIVATSSLELGIDMGAIELVVQIESAPSVASALQRIGRAGHQVGAISRGVVFPKHRGDLLPVAAVAEAMAEGEVEETFYPRNPLDVLCQQVVAEIAATDGPVSVDALYDLMRQAAPFAELPRESFEGVLDMMSGRYPAADLADLTPRLVWDRALGMVRARPGTLRVAIQNGGTIADRGLYGVFLAGADEGADKKKSRRVGELDEEMVFESRVGEVFMLGATSWRIEEITRDRVLVSPAPGEPGKMPFWRADGPGRPAALGFRIGALTRKLAAMPRAAAEAHARTELGFDARGAKNLLDWLGEQQATAALPTDETIVVERFVDEVGDYRVCVLSPLGARVHAPWATAVAAKLKGELEARGGGEVDALHGNDGMIFRLPASSRPPEASWFVPSSEEIEGLVLQTVSQTSVFAARFREAAGRALLLPRKSPERRTPLWALRKRAQDLLSVASQHPSFPMIMEAYRECLREVYDLPALIDVLRRIEHRRMRVTVVDSREPSPFASSLLFSYVGNFLYEGDVPLAERRALALGVDPSQLRALLGEAELRELLDPEAIDEHESMLQRLEPERRARHEDALTDLLRGLGDLDDEELARRADPPEKVADWCASLARERRIGQVVIGGARRWIAAEDAARYRDALGVVPPRGLPSVMLEPVEAPLDDLIRRWARTHGPFTADTLARRWALAPHRLEEALTRIARDGRVIPGEFLRGGRGREWCDAEVLAVLRRKSLARARAQVEPVGPDAFTRFLLDWQGVVRPSARARRGHLDALLGAIERLAGAPIPASVLERDVLPSRVVGYSPSDLDALTAAGEVTWAGIEPIGVGDGRIALYLAEHEPLLARPIVPFEGSLAAAIRAALERRGAMFFSEIARAVGGFPNDVVETLWGMVWSGELTNDTLAPLRARVRPSAPERRRDRLRPGRVAQRIAAPPGTEGRWSLRRARMEAATGSPPSETERRVALTRVLLDRYGVLCREAAAAESIEQGFSSVYDVLRRMEESGRVRRGYFVAGLGAAQFALPGADDRLRDHRTVAAAPADAPELRALIERTRVLAATDPAQPYGAIIGWPSTSGADASAEGDGARPQRAAGARVILFDGALTGFLAKNETALRTFLPDAEPERSLAARALAEALGAAVDDGGLDTLLLSSIDGAAPGHSPFARALLAAGFTAGARGMLRKPRAS